MAKKLTVILMALIISVCSMSACTSQGSDDTSSVQTSSQAEASSAVQTASPEASLAEAETNEMFADGDTRSVESEDPNAVITLSGDTGTLSDTTRGTSGSEVTITSKGIYEVTGTSENVTIIVDDEKKSGNIYLVLNGVSMTNSEMPCIYVKNSEKVIIVCKSDDNTLTYTNTDSSNGLDGAVYGEDDITVQGNGKLNVTSSLHGIVCENDLKLTGAALDITADSIGIKADDSVRIGETAAVNITAGHDGIQVENDEGDSFIYMDNGVVSVNAEYDGIDVKGSSEADFTGYIKLIGGTLDITSGGGSDNSKDNETSQKGIKCDGDIITGDIMLNVSSADDAVNSNGSVTVDGGTVDLSSSDDGITTAGTLTINSGILNVSKSYEALEAAEVTINDGTVSVTSTDDGINAGGGSDSSSDEKAPGSESNSGLITINGGNVYVDASGDGIDSNGSIVINGGTVIVEGPTDNGNGAIDKGDGADCKAEINGGTVLAIGSSGMAINFDSGTQCSALVSLSGSAGNEITVSGTEFSFTASKSFECVVFSSPELKQGEKYTISAGGSSSEIELTSLYYSDVQSFGGKPGGR